MQTLKVNPTKTLADYGYLPKKQTSTALEFYGYCGEQKVAGLKLVAAAEWWILRNREVTGKFLFTHGPLKGYMFATIIHKTDKAVLLRLQQHPYETVHDMDMWIPRSAIHAIEEA